MESPNLLVMLTIFVAVMGPIATIAVLGYAAIKALGRNPSSANRIFLGMIILVVFVEAISIVSMIVIFQIFTQQT